MADIRCKKCSEPWDVWGLDHGDVTPQQAAAIKRGFGCPCCKENGHEFTKEYIAMESSGTLCRICKRPTLGGDDLCYVCEDERNDLETFGGRGE